jgi:hypothetical protein
MARQVHYKGQQLRQIEEEKKMKTKLIATLLLAGSSLFAGPRVFFGVGVGVPVAPAPVVAYATPCPGPGYAWVGGGYYFAGGRRLWREGYWRAPYARVAPHYYGRFR